MDNYPYNQAAFTFRRELEPSTLNGDAHHSLSGRVELRIWPLLIIKHPNAAEHNRSRPLFSPDFREAAALNCSGLPHKFLGPKDRQLVGPCVSAGVCNANGVERRSCDTVWCRPVRALRD